MRNLQGFTYQTWTGDQSKLICYRVIWICLQNFKAEKLLRGCEITSRLTSSPPFPFIWDWRVGMAMQCGECLQCWHEIHRARLCLSYQEVTVAWYWRGVEEICLIAFWSCCSELKLLERGKFSNECKHLDFPNQISNIASLTLSLARVSSHQNWYKTNLWLSPQVCGADVSRVSKVHRLPYLRSVYPRSSGNKIISTESHYWHTGLASLPWLRLLFSNTGREELDPELSCHLSVGRARPSQARPELIVQLLILESER